MAARIETAAYLTESSVAWFDMMSAAQKCDVQRPAENRRDYGALDMEGHCKLDVIDKKC